MIQKDQPACFPKNVKVILSSVDDGTMLDRSIGVHDRSVVLNRQKLCKNNGVNYDNVVYQRIVYGDARTYDLIAEVDDGSTTKNTSEIVADTLYTRARNVALMLPVADCAATVVYDPKTETLSMLHLGRHSTMTPLLSRVLQKMIDEGASSSDIIVWMSPNAHARHYVMNYFDQANDPDWQGFCDKQSDGYHIDLQGYNRSICLKRGLQDINIHISPIDTVTSRDYFSHSAGDTHGRFAVVAMMC